MVIFGFKSIALVQQTRDVISTCTYMYTSEQTGNQITVSNILIFFQGQPHIIWNTPRSCQYVLYVYGYIYNFFSCLAHITGKYSNKIINIWMKKKCLNTPFCSIVLISEGSSLSKFWVFSNFWKTKWIIFGNKKKKMWAKYSMAN